MPAIGWDYCARVYREAAQAITPNPLDGLKGDFGPDPLVFLFRHSVEVRIKSILLDFGSMTKDKINPKEVRERGHDLCQQIGDLSRLAVLAGKPLSRATEKTICQLNGVDPKGTLFRFVGGHAGVEDTSCQFDIGHLVMDVNQSLNEMERIYEALQVEFEEQIKADISANLGA